jgi:hypothetical protein
MGAAVLAVRSRRPGCRGLTSAVASRRTVDPERVYAFLTRDRDDLVLFAQALASFVKGSPSSGT